MNDTATVTERVAKGVEVLEAYDPSWYLEVSLDRLDMGSAYTCVLAQVAGRLDTWDDEDDDVSRYDYGHGLNVLGLDSGRDYGFDADAGRWDGSSVEPFEAWESRRDADYAALDAEWRRVILAKRDQEPGL